MFITILALTSTAASASPQLLSPRVRYQWNYINYTWPSSQSYNAAIRYGFYVKEHNVVSGVKVWQDRVYLTIPRLKSGVPVTLAYVGVNDSELAPLLRPFPNWRMQAVGDCRALQLVQSMEIDPWGRMWVINNGRIEIRAKEPKTLCPSRLMILDLENEGKILLDYEFPEGVVNSSSVYLNDLVIDHEDGGWAYITDNDSKQPGIVVFSLRERTSWKVSHDESMTPSDEALEMSVNGTSFVNRSPVNGIALSPASVTGRRFVYYYPLSSYELFAVPTRVLKSPGMSIGRYVVKLGRKPSQSGGMVMSARGILYYGLLTLDTVAGWDTSEPPFESNQHSLVVDHARSQYPDSFALDNSGRLWYTSNRLQAFRTDAVDTSRPNIRLIVAETSGDKGYQYYSDGRVPESKPRIV